MRRIVGFAVAGLLVIALTGCTARPMTFRPDLRSVESTVSPAARRVSVPRALTTHLAKKEAPLPRPVNPWAYRPARTVSGSHRRVQGRLTITPAEIARIARPVQNPPHNVGYSEDWQP